MRSNSVARFLIAILVFFGVLAFTPDMNADQVKTCAAFLTTEEVEFALGMKVQVVDPIEYSEGFTSCSWLVDRDEGQLGVNFYFFEIKAIREGMISAESIPEFFDLSLATMRDGGGGEPQKLTGIGKRAVLFANEENWTVLIETDEGFAQVSVTSSGVEREQAVAVGKVAASRSAKE